MEGVVVVEALCNGDREVKIGAATEIRELKSKQRQKLVDGGVIDPLVSMLHSQDHEQIEAALFALLTLGFGSERNKIQIAKSGSIPALLMILQCESETLIQLGLAALLILSSCTANKPTIAASGAIQYLVEIINEEISTTQAKHDAIATLNNLSTSHHIIPSIISSGTVFSLLQLLHNTQVSFDVAERAMGLLENIVSQSEIALREVASVSGAIRVLVEAVEEGTTQCKEHAVGILLLLCQSGREKYRGLILREGAMPGLLQLGVDGTRRAKDLARALLLLLRDHSRSKGMKNSILEKIMEEIDAEKERVSEKALRLVEEMIAKLNS